MPSSKEVLVVDLNDKAKYQKLLGGKPHNIKNTAGEPFIYIYCVAGVIGQLGEKTGKLRRSESPRTVSQISVHIRAPSFLRLFLLSVSRLRSVLALVRAKIAN